MIVTLVSVLLAFTVETGMPPGDHFQSGGKVAISKSSHRVSTVVMEYIVSWYNRRRPDSAN